MGQYELVFAIFSIIIVIYAIVFGLKFLLGRSGKSENEIIKNAKDRKDMK